MIKNERALRAGIIMLAIVTAMAAIGAFIDPFPKHELSRALMRPSLKHFFGCDQYGVDLAQRIVAGAWHSLQVASIVTLITTLIGLLVGTLVALGSPQIKFTFTQIINCLMAFPGLLLAILIAAVMPHSEATIIFTLSLTRWTTPARFSQTLIAKLATEPFVEAAQAAGATIPRIVVKHIWPSMLGQLYVQAALFMSSVIFAEAGLSFLGLGGSSGNTSWGRLIAEGREYLVEAPHLSFFPGIAFLFTVLAFMLLAEGLRNRLDRRRNVGVY